MPDAEYSASDEYECALAEHEREEEVARACANLHGSFTENDREGGSLLAEHEREDPWTPTEHERGEGLSREKSTIKDADLGFAMCQL